MRPRPLLSAMLVHFAHDRLVARRRAHLRDAGAHQAATQHTNGFDLHLILTAHKDTNSKDTKSPLAQSCTFACDRLAM